MPPAYNNKHGVFVPRSIRIKTINRKITDVRSSANDIQAEVEALRDEIRASLTTIEDGLRIPAAPSQKIVA